MERNKLNCFSHEWVLGSRTGVDEGRGCKEALQFREWKLKTVFNVGNVSLN